jgi:hypothetical protein
MNELGDLGSSLSNHTPQNIYEVPHGYFEGFATHLLIKIKALEVKDASDEIKALSPLLAGIKRQNPYSVPPEYFNSLEQKMVESIQQNPDYQTADEELNALSPLLDGLNKKTPYFVPDSYFENLHTEIIKNVTKKTGAKIVSLTSRRLYRYAAAAVIAGIILLGGVFYLNQQNNKNNPVEAAKAWANVEKQVEKISDKELKDFVQLVNTNDLTTQEGTVNKSIASEDVNNLLKDISDKELQEFLDQTSDNEDDALLMN